MRGALLAAAIVPPLVMILVVAVGACYVVRKRRLRSTLPSHDPEKYRPSDDSFATLPQPHSSVQVEVHIPPAEHPTDIPYALEGRPFTARIPKAKPAELTLPSPGSEYTSCSDERTPSPSSTLGISPTPHTALSGHIQSPLPASARSSDRGSPSSSASTGRTRLPISHSVESSASTAPLDPIQTATLRRPAGEGALPSPMSALSSDGASTLGIPPTPRTPSTGTSSMFSPASGAPTTPSLSAETTSGVSSGGSSPAVSPMDGASTLGVSPTPHTPFSSASKAFARKSATSTTPSLSVETISGVCSGHDCPAVSSMEGASLGMLGSPPTPCTPCTSTSTSTSSEFGFGFGVGVGARSPSRRSPADTRSTHAAAPLSLNLNLNLALALRVDVADARSGGVEEEESAMARTGAGVPVPVETPTCVSAEPLPTAGPWTSAARILEVRARARGDESPLRES